MTPISPSYNSEAQQITSGNPDAFVIVDFPETFVKVGPALERTGNWDPAKTFITDGLADDTLVAENAELMEGIRGTAPGTPEEGAASQAFDAAYKAAPPQDVRSTDVRRPEFRRGDALLPRSGRCRLH